MLNSVELEPEELELLELDEELELLLDDELLLAGAPVLEELLLELEDELVLEEELLELEVELVLLELDVLLLLELPGKSIFIPSSAPQAPKPRLSNATTIKFLFNIIALHLMI